MRRRFKRCVPEGSKYTRWIGFYLSFHLSWVLGPFVHGRLQILQTSEVTFTHDITPLTDYSSIGLSVMAFLLLLHHRIDNKYTPSLWLFRALAVDSKAGDP